MTKRYECQDDKLIELLSAHYNERNMSFDKFPNWDEDPVWVCREERCTKPKLMQCEDCSLFCFNEVLRGQPPRSFRWYLDTNRDGAILLQQEKHIRIRKDVLKDLRRNEVSLRMISRKWVLHDLVLRFRGYKRDKDTIDEILQDHGFTSLSSWITWKESFDNLIREKIYFEKTGFMFCTGCGERSTRFTAMTGKYRGELFEKCSNSSCDFFYRVGSNFASVNKKF